VSRIDPEHPLTRAAREVNAYAGEADAGLQETLDWLGMDVAQADLAYLAEQRALRAVAASRGIDLGTLDPVEAERIAREIVTSPGWAESKHIIVSAYLDGIGIGWKGRMLRDSDDFYRALTGPRR
jgi:hypothetical protein